MATNKLLVKINSTTFPGVGNPLSPKGPSDAKAQYPNTFKGAVKDEYTSFYNQVTKGGTSTAGYYVDAVGGTRSMDALEVSFDYEPGIPQTYKFLGMDINTDFQAVIPVGDGSVVVAEMFDPKGITSADLKKYSTVSSADNDLVNNYILNKCNASVVRRLATAMKTGLLYELYDSINKDSATVRVEHILKLVELVDEDLNTNTNSIAVATGLSSITLSLAREAELEKVKATKGSSPSKSQMTLSAIFLAKCFSYWYDVVERYIEANQVLSCIDLWSSAVKKCMGEDLFNQKATNAFTLIDNNKGTKVPGIVAITGVSRNGSYSDSDTIRLPIKSSLESLSKTLTGGAMNVSSMEDMFLGNFDYEVFDNPYELTVPEMQAMSNYDSLQNVDEDAKVCIESYNMDDPDERGLFIKSAVRSYEKNFREYKPVSNYDVTEAMADLVERGEDLHTKLVPELSVGNNPDPEGYVVTSTPEQIEILLTRKSLLKVSKLLNKTLTSVASMFP